MSSSRTSKSVLFFNPFSVGVAIFVAASLAMISPLAAQSGGKALDSSVDALPGTDAPPSMQSTVQVMVEMKAPAAAVPYAAALKVAQAQADAARSYALTHPKLKSSQALLSSKQPVQISSTSARQVANSVRQLDQAQRAILPALTAPNIGGKVIYRVQRAYNGIAMQVSPDKISQIAALPGVKAVHPIHLKYHTAFTDIDFTGARSFWALTTPFGGAHGENVKVAVIDSGLDYVHTNFGGTGSYAGVGDASGATGGQFPSVKVPGGTDLCGDAYNGGNVPVPDSNPFDGDPTLGASAGHGTACASLVGGYGVDAGGTTYIGSYDAVNPNIVPQRISPGYAPNCKLYPIRVFGNSGGTGLVTLAIDYAMDPNGDANFSDHMDIISMSLGSNEGYADDDSAVASSNAASVGIVVCSASGNAADTYYITSSPAVASGTLSVAASFNDQGGFIFNATVTPNTNAGAGSPPDGTYKAIHSPPSPTPPIGGLTGDVAYGVPNDASPALAASPSPAPGIAYYGTFTNAASVAGKICLVDRGAGVGFMQKCARAQNSGAIGVIVTNASVPGADPVPMGGLTTELTIPCIMISNTDRLAIIAAAGGFDPVTGLPTNSPVNVTIANGNGAFIHATTATDTMPGYSSRGPRLGDSALKPDITAPAEIVGVATNRSGNLVQNFNGTSSATPHVAGSMALMRQTRPTWTVEELMALAINTATHELTTGPSPVPLAPAPSPGQTYGVSRVGAGRIDLTKASQANVVAFNQTNPNLVSVSFGVVEVPADSTTTLTKAIKIKNNSGASVTYNVTYQDITPASGASFTVPGAPIVVGAGATVPFDVSFSAIGSALRHERDPSATATQATATNTSRQWLTEKAGYAVLTPTSGPEPVIRVPLYAAPKPVSTMHATTTGVVPEAASGTFTINLSGLSINTGATYPNDIVSLAKPFELQYASSQVGSPNAPTDANVLKYVGVTSDWTNRTVAQRNAGNVVVTFALEGFGDQSVPEFNSSDKEILIDFDFDSVYDAVIFCTSRANTAAQNFHSNVYRGIYVDIANIFGFGANAQLGMAGPTNLINPSVRDTNSFNNSATLVPVAGVALVGTGFSSFNYQVVTFDRNGDQVDETPVLFWDAAAPGFDTIPAASSAQTVPSAGTLLEPFMFTDLATTSIAVNYNGTNFQNNASLGVLLVHMHNASGVRTDVVAFRKPTITSFSPSSGAVGALITIAGSNFGPGTIVKFFNNKTATINILTANTLVATVPAGAVDGPIRVSNAAGSSQSATNFDVLP